MAATKQKSAVIIQWIPTPKQKPTADYLINTYGKCWLTPTPELQPRWWVDAEWGWSRYDDVNTITRNTEDQAFNNLYQQAEKFRRIDGRLQLTPQEARVMSVERDALKAVPRVEKPLDYISQRTGLSVMYIERLLGNITAVMELRESVNHTGELVRG